MSLEPRWRAGLIGAAIAALLAASLLAATLRLEDATLPDALWVRFLPLAAAAALGFLVAAPIAARGPWSGRELGWALGTGAGVGAAAYLLIANLVPLLAPLRLVGIPLLLSLGLAVLAPLVAARAVPRPGGLTLGLLAALLARRLLGGTPSIYPALELLQLPLSVLLAEAWLAATEDRLRQDGRLAAAGALLGLGSVGTVWLLLPGAGVAADRPGELVAGAIAGAVTGWLVARAPSPEALRERLEQRGG